MQKGSEIVHRVPGRAGWELRAVVQGGLRVLGQVEALGATALRQRPALRKRDALPVFWCMLLM